MLDVMLMGSSAQPPAERPDISGMAFYNAPILGASVHHDCVSYGDRVLFIGGFGGSGPTQSFGYFDTTQQVWGGYTQLPWGRMGHVSVVSGNYLYVAGGALDGTPTYTNRLDRFNLTTNTWQRMADLPLAWKFGDGCVANGKIYLFGGQPAGGNDASPTLFHVFVYDIATNTWQDLTGTVNISPRWDSGVCAYKGKIYILGGRYNSACIRDFYQYDPVAGTLRTLPPPPISLGIRRQFIAFREWLVAMFGATVNDTTINDVPYRFNPDTEVWESWAAAPTRSRAVGGVSAVGNSIYCFSGYRAGAISDNSCVFK